MSATKQHVISCLPAGLVLTLSEVFKQFFCYYVIADGTYHWGEFPFQLCSIPMYLCLIVPWLKLENCVGHCIASWCCIISWEEPLPLPSRPACFMATCSLPPTLACGTCCWCLWDCSSACPSEAATRRATIASATWIFTLLCGVAFALNCIVQFGIGRDMNMFFVGPGNSSHHCVQTVLRMVGMSTPPFNIRSMSGSLSSCSFLIYWLHNKELPSRRKRLQSKV